MKKTAPHRRSRIHSEVVGQSDRACAIVSGSMLEAQLEQLLRKSMIEKPPNELFSTYGPLSTFAAKIDISTAMGLISKSERSDLHRIRKIRNIFAHSLEEGLEFRSSAIHEEIKSLNYCRSKITGLKTSIRVDFESSVAVLVGFLESRTEQSIQPKSPPDLKESLWNSRRHDDSDSGTS